MQNLNIKYINMKLLFLMFYKIFEHTTNESSGQISTCGARSTSMSSECTFININTRNGISIIYTIIIWTFWLSHRIARCCRYISISTSTSVYDCSSSRIIINSYACRNFRKKAELLKILISF